jgi:serine/threonine-protein kinase
VSELGRSFSQTGGALERDEHVSTVLRLRRACAVGVVVWPAFALIDWFLVTFVQPGRLWFYLVLRAIGLVPLGIAVLVIYGKRMPTPAVARWMEAGVCACLSALISVSALEYGGIVSPLVLGVILILLGRSAIIADRWERAALPIGLITLVHPLTLGVLALIDARLGAQFRDARALAGFALNEMFLLSAGGMTLVGGHMIWSLRRQVFEARSLGRYRLKRRIGSGGMGEVWAAHHHALRRDVAVKILKPETRGDAAAIARFEREVRATADLIHPHTVRVFDYGVTEDGLWYYAMELLEGKDLHQVVATGGPVAPPRAARLMWQASKALAEAHARGIVHRDLKPENLFVTAIGGEGEFIKVLDFGLAKLAVTGAERNMTLTGEGWAVGTPKWASPEVVSGEPADPRSDVYGLGAVLYFLLCGAAPFEHADVGKMLMAHVNEKPVPPSQRGVRLPAALEAVVMRCLEKDPARRYAEAGALAAALASAYSAEPAAQASGAARPAAPRAIGSESWEATVPVASSPAALAARGVGGDSMQDVTRVKPRAKSPGHVSDKR